MVTTGFENKHLKTSNRTYCPKVLCVLVCQLLKSLDHRRAGAGRDLWRPSSPAPLPEQVQLPQGAQDLLHVAFGYLQGRKLHNPAQSLPVLCHPQRKEVFPPLQTELTAEAEQLPGSPALWKPLKCKGPCLQNANLKVWKGVRCLWAKDVGHPSFCAVYKDLKSDGNIIFLLLRVLI